MRSYFVLSFASPGFMNSLMSSSHLLVGLPTNPLVLILLSSPGCQLKIFWSIFVPVGMLFYLPFATSVLCVFQSSKVSSFSSCSLRPLWYFSWCIQSSLLSVVSIVSLMSSCKDTSLSWSLSEFWSEPSSVFSGLAFCFSICIFFLFVQWGEASFVAWSWSFFRVFVIMSMFHWRRSMLAWWPYRKDDEVCGKVGSLSRSIIDDICGTLLTLLSACFWSLQFLAPRTRFFCPRYRALSLSAKTSISMLLTVISFAFILSWLLRIFVLSGWIPSPTASVLVLNSHSI